MTKRKELSEHTANLAMAQAPMLGNQGWKVGANFAKKGKPVQRNTQQNNFVAKIVKAFKL